MWKCWGGLAILWSIAVLSHVSVRPHQLSHSLRSSVVQHLLICNNKSISACRRHDSATKRGEKTRKRGKEKREAFHPSPLEVWHKDNIVVVCFWPLSAEERLTVLPVPNAWARAIWPTASSVWWHQLLDWSLLQKASTLANDTGRGATFNHSCWKHTNLLGLI